MTHRGKCLKQSWFWAWFFARKKYILTTLFHNVLSKVRSQTVPGCQGTHTFCARLNEIAWFASDDHSRQVGFDQEENLLWWKTPRKKTMFVCKKIHKLLANKNIRFDHKIVQIFLKYWKLRIKIPCPPPHVVPPPQLAKNRARYDIVVMATVDGRCYLRLLFKTVFCQNENPP